MASVNVSLYNRAVAAKLDFKERKKRIIEAEMPEALEIVEEHYPAIKKELMYIITLQLSYGWAQIGLKNIQIGDSPRINYTELYIQKLLNDPDFAGFRFIESQIGIGINAYW